jgi:hypothetical protein
MVGGQRLTQSSAAEDCVRRCPTMYCPPSTSWRLCQTLSSYHVLISINKLKIVSDVVLLPCTDQDNVWHNLQLVDGGQYMVGGGQRLTQSSAWWWRSVHGRRRTTSDTISWRLCHTLSSYHVLTSINKLKIVSDVVLLLPCTDLHQQVEDCVRRCPPTMYWPPSTSWRLCQTLSSSHMVGGQRVTQSSTCWWRSVHGRRTTSDTIFSLLMEVSTW